jgi:PAS domain S-box-containing protein
LGKIHNNFLCFLLLILFCFLIENLHGDPVVTINSILKSYSLGTDLMILEDPEKKMEFSEVIKARDAGLFRKSTSPSPSFGYSSSAFWVYVTLKNNLIENYNFLIEILNMDDIQLYLPDKAGGYSLKRAGVSVENPDGFLKYGNVLFKLTIPAQQSLTLFIRFENQDPMIIQVKLWNLENYFLANQTKQIFYGLYLGIIGAMILYNLFIFLTLKDISYLFYVFYVFSIGFYHLFSANVIQEYFFNLHPWLMDNLETFAVGFVYIWGIQFCRHYLLTRKNTPRWDNVLRIGILFGLILILSPLVLPFVIRSIISNIGILLIVIFILVSVILCLKKGYRPTFFYLFAWSVVAIGATTFMLRNFALLPSFFITDDSIIIGSVLEALLLSFGLAYRIDILRKEKEQAKASALESMKKANKFKHDYHQLFLLNPLGIALLDTKGVYIAANPAYCAIYDSMENEIIGQDYIDTIIPENERETERKNFAELVKKNKKQLKAIEQQHITKMGRIITIKCNRDFTTNEKEETVGLLLCTEDITENKKQSDQLNTSLEEKEHLLRELHHRVKNNLQIITSLINFKLRNLQDKEALEIFKSIQNRIYSISLVHNRSYLSKNLAKVSFKEYIQNLINHLLSTIHVNTDKIAIKINVRGVDLNISYAIPCGLIINELVTNSLKYAFPNTNGGSLKISFYKEKNKLEDSRINYILEIRDNGIGFPEDFNYRNTETFGIQLVSTLVEQLEGKIDKIGKKGVGFKITFSLGKE